MNYNHQGCKYIVFIVLLFTAFFSYGQNNITENDIDGDSIINTADNCSEKSNYNQLDSDNDGFGNVCDADYDNNNIVDNNDFSIFVIKLTQNDPAADLNGDGSVGFLDLMAFSSFHGSSPGPGATDETVEEPLLATIIGKVVNTEGVLVPNSRIIPFKDGIAIGDAVNADSDGEFTLDLPAQESLSLLVSAPSYANQVVAIYSPSENGIMQVRTTLIKRGELITIRDTGVNTYTGGVGTAVTFDKADFVNSNGGAIVGDIELTITPVDVSKPATIAAFPGSYSGVGEDNAEPSEIISLGTVEYHFTQDGNPINLAPGKTAEVLLPIYIGKYQNGENIDIGDRIPLWSLNEETGMWKQEGTGEVVASDDSTTGLAMRAIVSHFSWWNVDLVAQTAQVEITVLGESTGDATVFANASNLAWNLANVGVSIGSTTDRLPVPAGTEVCFYAGLTYYSGAFSFSNTECIVANIGEVVSVTLTGQPEGELDVITRPIGAEQDKLRVYTTVNQAVPVSIAPLTAETAVLYTVTDGQLPNGLSIDTAGESAYIVGAPTTTGAFNFTITATDSDGFTDEVVFDYDVDTLAENEISLTFSETDNLNLTIGLFSGSALLDWGDGNRETIAANEHNNSLYDIPTTTLNHLYSSPQAGRMKITFSDGVESARVLSVGGNKSNYNFDLSVLSKLTNLEILFIGKHSLTGSLSSLPRKLKRLALDNAAEVIGAASDLPVGLVQLSLRSFSMNIRMSELPKELEHLRLLEAGDTAEVTGSFVDLPQGLTSIYLYNGRRGSVSGDLSELPNTLTAAYFLSAANALITGGLDSLNTGMKYFWVSSSNNINGNLIELPINMESFLVYGSNTITGKIDVLPDNMRHLTLLGKNTVNGDITDLKATMSQFTLGGENTLTGDIANLPQTVNQFEVYGENTIYGNLGELKANNIWSLRITGSNSINDFSLNSQWKPVNLYNLYLFSEDSSSGFNSEEIDRLLILLNENVRKNNRGRIDILRPSDASPTSASEAAISSLEGKGFRINTN